MIGRPSGRKSSPWVRPNSPALGKISGNNPIGTPKKWHKSSPQLSVRRSIKSVRDAFVASVTWRRPPVRCHSKKLSTVPAASSPLFARARAFGMWSSIQAIFVAEKYGSSTSPVFSESQERRSRCRSQKSAVRRSCQTRAGPIALPLARSQTIVVSRWFVIPMADSRSAPTPELFNALVTSGPTEAMIAAGSCSTHPGRGYVGGTSACAWPTGRSRAIVNHARRMLVVPESIDSRWSRAIEAIPAKPNEAVFSEYFARRVTPYHASRTDREGIGPSTRSLQLLSLLDPKPEFP